MSIMIKIAPGCEVAVVDYVVHLVALGRLDKARRSVSKMYCLGWKRSEAVVLGIKKHLEKKKQRRWKFLA